MMRMSCEPSAKQRLTPGSDRSPNPHHHLTAPQRTPTSVGFAEGLFRTPRTEKELFDSSGWTPVFAEEYTLFNATPGRFTNIQGTFSPRPTAATGHKRQHSSTETLKACSLHSTKGGRPPTSLSTLGTCGLLYPSTNTSPSSRGGFDTLGKRTPRKASSLRPEAAVTGQTATPPQSRHKHARRASLADAETKMQNEQDFYSQSGTMDGGGYDLSFATPTNVDLFQFPMPGPATAPAYMNGKSLWDPSNGMTDMTTNFQGDPFAAEDWTADMFQQQQMHAPALPQGARSTRKPRPLLAKPRTPSMPAVQSGITFDFGMAALSEDPFTMPSPGTAINPNNLFSFTNMSPSMATIATFNTGAVQSNSQMELPPQPALLSPLAIPRSQSVQSMRPQISHMRRPISPLKSTRPSTSSMSDNLNRPPALKAPAPLSADAQPPSNFAGKGRYSSGTGSASTTAGRSSPTKQGIRTNLQAIPEQQKLFNPRTAVTFSIDANGRARTETVILDPSAESRLRISNSRTSTHGASPRFESSTDEEVIVIPSRNPSFAQKDKNRPLNMPKMARFDTSTKQYPRPRTGERKLSAGNVKALSRDALALNDEIDDEIIDTSRRSPGDASNALRRVMENRRRSVSGITSMPPATNTQTIRIQSTSHVAGSHRDRERHYRRQSYASSSNTAYSASTPSTATDLDNDVDMCDTPSTVASGNESTRCVCQRREREGDEFMIQWYVFAFTSTRFHLHFSFDLLQSRLIHSQSLSHHDSRISVMR